jgi:hypothetical protein
MLADKGLQEEDWTDRNNWRMKITMAKWAQEDGNIVQPAK